MTSGKLDTDLFRFLEFPTHVNLSSFLKVRAGSQVKVFTMG
ncbi:hypothetical protein CKA32_000827 [Geitlerinema sp. FC II]|nr:hypothetical protein CKA32_000827 [Geitlerinema sp. FC II]